MKKRLLIEALEAFKYFYKNQFLIFDLILFYIILFFVFFWCVFNGRSDEEGYRRQTELISIGQSVKF